MPTVMVLRTNRKKEGNQRNAGESSLKYWESVSGKKAEICASCLAPAEVAVYVRRMEGDPGLYLVPLCSRCAAKTDDFFVEGGLVPAEKI